jgi:glycine/D-amino acid oxidase-like deaminating enzyme
VLVVGAGVLGAALAQRLADRSWDVTVVDVFEPGHGRAASSGSSRLLRSAHGDNAEDSRSACEAGVLWRQLEVVLGAELLVPAGIAYFVPRGGPWLAASSRILAELRVPIEVLDGTEARRLFPSVAVPEGEVVVLEPGGGVLLAAQAVRALVRHALARGATLLRGRALPAGPHVDLDGRRLAADRVVWACGAWNARLFPALLDVDVIEQDLLFFGAPPGWATPGVPGWLDIDAAFSGTGDLAGRGVKVGADRPGPLLDLDSAPPSHDPAQEAAARSYLCRRFPALSGAPLVGVESCHSVVVRRNDLANIAAPGGIGIAAHPEHPSVWVLGDGSGHGFKHGPSIAKLVEELISRDL